MAEPNIQHGAALAEVSNAVVKLHKEQFGRGPTHSRADYAGRDVLVCTLENALLPAERALIQMGNEQGVRDSRTQLQAATAQLFIAAIEERTGRKVRAFASALDPGAGVVFEVWAFEPPDDVASTDGRA
jgi:uncharacterized protein YbcI